MNTEILNITATGIEMLINGWRPKLASLDSEHARSKPTPDRWSISEVIGHLIDSACNNHQRIVRAQYCDNELVFPKYDQNEWAIAANYLNADWESLVELWYHYNRMIASLIRNIKPEALQTPCTITPYDPCTLEFLVTDYLSHLQHHFNILEERMT